MEPGLSPIQPVGDGQRHRPGREAEYGDQELHSYATLQERTKIVTFEPHLHAPGVRMCLQAVWGHYVQTLNCVGYDHNWVGPDTIYADDAAPLLPKGTILHLVAFLDTTSANPNLADGRNWAGGGRRSLVEHVHQPWLLGRAHRGAVPGRDGQAPHQHEEPQRLRHRLSAVLGAVVYADARRARPRRATSNEPSCGPPGPGAICRTLLAIALPPARRLLRRRGSPTRKARALLRPTRAGGRTTTVR